MSAEQVLDPRKRKIAARIAKLLRRAERDDGPESVTARAMAEELMAKHGIEVDLHEFEEGPRPLVGERIVMFLRTREEDTWAQFLLQEIAGAYHCISKPHESVGVGWMFYIVGPPAQLEPCAIHFEYLLGKIRALGDLVAREITNPQAWFQSPRAEDGVHWGVMDGFLSAINEKRMRAGPAASASVDAHVTKLAPLLALNPAEHIAVRGDELAVCKSGEAPFGMGFELPPDVDPGQRPRWAWMRGFTAARESQINPEPPTIVYGPLLSLDLSHHVAHLLEQNGVHTVAQLLRLRAMSLLDLGIEESGILEIIERLGEHDLFLTPDWETP